MSQNSPIAAGKPTARSPSNKQTTNGYQAPGWWGGTHQAHQASCTEQHDRFHSRKDKEDERVQNNRDELRDQVRDEDRDQKRDEDRDQIRDLVRDKNRDLDHDLNQEEELKATEIVESSTPAGLTEAEAKQKDTEREEWGRYRRKKPQDNGGHVWD